MAGGAPQGNNNAAKAKRWTAAIEKALETRSRLEGQQALAKLAEKLIEAAENGESWALKEVGDRIEGKPAQSMTVSGDEDKPFVTVVERRIVKATDSDG